VQDRGKIDQSSNELITETFGVDGMLFICIENRILQYDRRACEEMTKKYDPILGFITSVSVNKDIILLGNVQNKIMYLSYREETRVRFFIFKVNKNLTLLSEYPLGNNFIMSLDFLVAGYPRVTFIY
jgi:hypothetical protein